MIHAINAPLALQNASISTQSIVHCRVVVPHQFDLHHTRARRHHEDVRSYHIKREDSPRRFARSTHWAHHGSQVTPGSRFIRDARLRATSTYCGINVARRLVSFTASRYSLSPSSFFSWCGCRRHTMARHTSLSSRNCGGLVQRPDLSCNLSFAVITINYSRATSDMKFFFSWSAFSSRDKYLYHMQGLKACNDAYLQNFDHEHISPVPA